MKRKRFCFSSQPSVGSRSSKFLLLEDWEALRLHKRKPVSAPAARCHLLSLADHSVNSKQLDRSETGPYSKLDEEDESGDVRIPNHLHGAHAAARSVTLTGISE